MLIYVLEDDENILELLTYSLGMAGFQTQGFNSSRRLLKHSKDNLPSLFLLDIMIAGKNEESGIEVAKKLKKEAATKDIPIIFLTAKTTEMDKAFGLDLGADDYIAKPFGILELIARIKAVLRRYNHSPKQVEKAYNLKDLEINISSKSVYRAGEALKLTHKEFELLVYLYENRGIVLSRDSLLDKVWGQEYYIESRTVDVHIKSLRQKLSDNADNPKYIQTVRGFGYTIIKE